MLCVCVRVKRALCLTASHPHLSVTEEKAADARFIRDRLIHIPSVHSDPRRWVCLHRVREAVCDMRPHIQTHMNLYLNVQLLLKEENVLNMCPPLNVCFAKSKFTNWLIIIGLGQVELYRRQRRCLLPI